MSHTDDVIRLASPRHQLCVLDECQSRELPSPIPDSPPVLKPTGPGAACQPCGDSQRPLFAPCPSQKKVFGAETEALALPKYKKKVSFLLASVSGGLWVGVHGEGVACRIEFQSLL